MSQGLKYIFHLYINRLWGGEAPVAGAMGRSAMSLDRVPFLTDDLFNK